MPIQRFGRMLISKGQFEAATCTLLKNALPARRTWTSVMCRTLLSVDWRGYVYDCDFNQMLELPLALGAKPRRTCGSRRTATSPATADRRRPIIAYGCTAGQGSSCGGALA